MDFTAFLLKKKIDISLFSRAEPALFAEFEREYAVMGPKSFDHTKKFWFNKLRRAYHLATQDKPKKTIEQTDSIAQASTLESPTIAQHIPGNNDSPESPALPKKPGFTPRFKAAVVVPKEIGEESVAVPEEVAENPEPAPVKKPGFTPRFKMTTVVKKDISEEPVPPAAPATENSEAPLPKPAYVPRFKAPVQKPAED